MKKSLFSFATLIIGLGIFIYAIKMIGPQLILDQFKTLEPKQIVIFLIVSSMLVTALIFKWKMVLKTMGYDISFFNLLMYRQMGYSIGYVVPSFYIGGQAIKAFFLRKHKVPTGDAVASVLIDRALEIPLNFLLACLMFFLALTTLNLPQYMVIILATLLAMFIAVGVTFFYKVFRKEYMFYRLFEIMNLGRFKKMKKIRLRLKETEDTLIKFFHHRKRFFPMALLFSMLLWLLMMLEFNTALMIVGFEATLTQVYLVVVMTGFAMMFPVPASIGVMELSQIAIAIMVGIPAPVAVALSLLIRTRDFLWIIMGIGSYFHHGTSYVKTLMRDIEEKKNGKD